MSAVAEEKQGIKVSHSVKPYNLLGIDGTFAISLNDRQEIVKQAKRGESSALLVLMLFNPGKTRDDKELLRALQQRFEYPTLGQEGSLYYAAASLLLSKISSPKKPAISLVRESLKKLISQKQKDGEFIPSCIRFVWARDALDAAIEKNTINDEAYVMLRDIAVVCQSLRGMYYYLYFTYHVGYNEAVGNRHGVPCVKPDIATLEKMVMALRIGRYPTSSIYWLLGREFMFSKVEKTLIQGIFPSSAM